MRSTFETKNIPYFDSYKEHWHEKDAEGELQHKLNDRVILQIITSEKESFGSLAESGLLALNAFLRGQRYGLYLENFGENPKSDTNRARTLVRAHAKKLNEQFPGIIYLANSIEDLTDFAINYMK